LTQYSDFKAIDICNLVKLCMFCLNNIVVQHVLIFITREGILTGDNNSVSIANTALHYTLLPIAKVLNQAELFKRNIDDIMFLAIGENITNKITDSLEQLRFNFSENQRQ